LVSPILHPHYTRQFASHFTQSITTISGMIVYTMPTGYYRTSEVARMVGLHPNTVRRYEEWGFLPPIPRAPNGYRMFGETHVDQIRLARLALQASWMGGDIRKRAYAVIYGGARGELKQAWEQAQVLRQMIREEQQHALAAASVLEQWVQGKPFRKTQAAPLSIGEAASYLAVTVDMLRNWERNGLIDVPRDPANGYRRYGPPEIARLRVIRTLRKARYSTMAILRMINAFEQGQRSDLVTVLDTPRQDEDMIFVTDRWLTTLAGIEQAMQAMAALLRRMIDRYT
jgi:DNA-binding transcriptional MerR regulator